MMTGARLLGGWLRKALAGGLILFASLSAGHGRAEEASFGRTTGFVLPNGLQVVVIEDHRTPVITHMVWYKFGAADDPPGASGLAHLLEHLMFRSFDAGAPESFAQIMSRLGAMDNATTGPDSTWYFQRAAKEHLPEIMAIEARRMSGLAVTEEQVLTERAVVREERRLVIESDPVRLLGERVMASLYLRHGYGRPPIGAADEIMALKRADALAAYRSFYVPANAAVVIAGDVTPTEVHKLAADTYGAVAGRMPPARPVITEPEPISARRVVMADARAAQPTLVRYYLTPSYRTAALREAESLEVLASLLGSGEASRLNRVLVNQRKVALASGANFFGEGRDSGQLAIFVRIAEGGDISAAEQALDEALADLSSGGIDPDELARAKSAIETRFILDSDSQQRLAMRYGQALAAGASLQDVADLPERLAQVSRSDVEAAAGSFLLARRSVTGVLTPAAMEEASR
jgi:zinc protease